jgi:hypothetical protein
MYYRNKGFKGITPYYSILKMSRRYENAKIYKLVSNKTEDVYIGSCLITLARRLGTHKSDYNKCSSKRMFEVPNAIITIVLIEALPNCKSKAEMKAKELHYMTVIPCINKNRPFVTDIKIVGGDTAEWMKARYVANATAILEQQKPYQTARRATPESKAYHKAYNAIPANKERKKA